MVQAVGLAQHPDIADAVANAVFNNPDKGLESWLGSTFEFASQACGGEGERGEREDKGWKV